MRLTYTEIKFPVRVVLLLFLCAGETSVLGQTLAPKPFSLIHPGNITVSNKSSIFELVLNETFPSTAVLLEIRATTIATVKARRCCAESLLLFTSSNLSDVEDHAAGTRGLPHRNCTSGEIGQIQRYLVSSLRTNIYISVLKKVPELYTLEAIFRESSASELERGSPARKGAQPWHAMIRRSSNFDSMEPMCSGVFLYDRWVVTAAHCLNRISAEEKSGRWFDVRLGAYSTQGDDKLTISFSSGDVLLHPQFDLYLGTNDIGIIRLPRAPSFSGADFLSLPGSYEQEWAREGLDVRMTFWNLDTNPLSSVNLAEEHLSLLSAQQCTRMSADLGLPVENIIDEPKQICARAVEPFSYCVGDTGSPLVGENGGQPVLLGVLTSGHRRNSSDFALVFTSILAYSRWILSAMDSSTWPAYWYPKALQIPFQQSSGDLFRSGPFRGVLMALETLNFTPSVHTYYGWRNPPHFTVHQNGSKTEIYQHYPINVAAQALMRGEKPAVNAIEIKLAWLSTEMSAIGADMKSKLRDLMRWIETETGIERKSPVFYQPFDAYGPQANQRMTELEWKYYNGWCGRQHIPGEDDPDPGIIDMDFLLTSTISERVYNFKLRTGAYSILPPFEIELSLAGNWRSSREYRISHDNLKSGSFQSKEVAEFSITTTTNLGTLQTIRLQAIGSSVSWLVSEIEVTTADAHIDLSFVFPVNRSFTSGKTSSRVFTVNGELGNFSADYTQDADLVNSLADGRRDCSISSVSDLANQILHQFYCDHGETSLANLSAFPSLCLDSAVTPIMQVDAATALRRLLAKLDSPLTVNSAFHSLPAQYVLTKWKQKGVCSQFENVEMPGKSDYMEGLAISVEQFEKFKRYAPIYGFTWGGSLSPKRFTYTNSRANTLGIQTEMIRSFQKLWSANNPGDELLPTGLWDHSVESRLANSPMNGFQIRPTCSFKKPLVPCCKAGKEAGVCALPSQCSTNVSCLAIPNPSLCAGSMFTTCCTSKQLGEGAEREPHPGPPYAYAVSIFFGDQPRFSTNTEVHIKLIGSYGESENIVFQSSMNFNALPESRISVNVSSSFELGDILYLDVGHFDNRFEKGFYLQKVSVMSSGFLAEARFDFYCNCWLDSSKGSIRKILKPAPRSLPDQKSSCDSLQENSTKTIKDVLENLSQCNPNSVLGLAQQIVDQTICNGVSISYIGNNPNFCLDNQAFPYLISDAYMSLQAWKNSWLYFVNQAMNPFLFQFFRKIGADLGFCGDEVSGAITTGTFDRGTAISSPDIGTLYENLIYSSKWEKPNGASYIKYSLPSSSDVVMEQIKAFQVLWNSNFFRSPVPVTGKLDNATIDALLKSPANGFLSGARCSLPRRLGSPCCTADKKRGLCVLSASCTSESRQGYCFDSSAVCCLGKSSLEVEFPSGLKLSESLPPAGLATEYLDPFGKHDIPLLNGTGIGSRLVSSSFRLQQFFDSSSEYLRLSSLLVQCLQFTQDASESTIAVTRGYETLSTAKSKGNASSVYRRGTAATISVAGESQSLKLAEHVLRGCLLWLRDSGRDLHIGLGSNSSVHVEIQETFMAWSLPGALLSTHDFQQWISNLISLIELPSGTGFFSGGQALTLGETFPSGVDDVATCGRIDGIIKRNSPDFDRLVQYSRHGIAFASEEADNKWCGWPGRKCVNCSFGPTGYSADEKCADRMMTARLSRFLTNLQQIVSAVFRGRIIFVKEAWDEPTSSSAYEWGSFNKQSLHYEGRAADIAISTDLGQTPNGTSLPLILDSSALGRLSAMAAQAGFDHVWYKDNETIQVAVKKALGEGRAVSFGKSSFLCVSPPYDNFDIYSLDAENGFVVGDLCLFDSDGRKDEFLSNNYRVADFLSQDSGRYFRLNPLIPQTLQMIRERLWSELKIELHIAKAYEPSKKMVYGSNKLHYLGQGIEIAAPQSHANSMLDLASIVLETAGHFLSTNGYGFGIELRNFSIYYDVRPEELYFSSASYNVSQTEWRDFVHSKLKQASRRINPSQSSNCIYASPCAPSTTYQWKPSFFSSSRVVSNCWDTIDSARFCESTKVYRREQVESIWNAVKQRQQDADLQNDLKNALTMCFETLCGRCYEGPEWEKKLEHCSNFLHWAPLDLGKENTVGALYVNDHENLANVCESGKYLCLEKTELYSILAPPLYALYPLQRGSSAKGELYSAGGNPLPVLGIMNEIFVMHLSGTVTVFVTNIENLTVLKNSLKILMAYNSKATEIVFVTFESQVRGVYTFLENSVAEWSSSLCSTNDLRQYFTPFTVKTFDSA